jgi:peptidoglycan/xylan/chitin deacetylase (PgdA/CDA1 family)
VTGITEIAAPARLPLLLTFDDGGSGYLAAADLLERHGWRGVVFVTTGCIGKAGFLGAGDLRSLQARGHVIGTHSRTHPMRLSALPVSAIRDEWRTSIRDLEDALGNAVRAGSVPGGYHSRAVAIEAAAAGLTTLFTSEPQTAVDFVDGCAISGRFTLRQSDRAEYAARLAGSLPIARLAQWSQWSAKKLAKTIGGTAYLRLRTRILDR